MASTSSYKAYDAGPATSGDTDEYDTYSSSARERAEALLLFVVVTGSIGAGVMLGMTAKGWLPGLKDAIFGPSPTAYFQLSRSSGLAAYALLWLSMMFGLLITNRLARTWPGGPEAFELHRYASLLSLFFILFHALVLLGDPHIQGRIGPLVTPFGVGYRTAWVGVGQLCLYLLLPVVGSFYLRRRLGKRTWRTLHFLTFALFAMALAHSVFSGPDTAEPWVSPFYWTTAATTVLACLYRIMVAMRTKSGAKSRAKGRTPATSPAGAASTSARRTAENPG